MKITPTLTAASIALLLLAAACKPTENNYKKAYDLAQARAHEDVSDDVFAMLKQEELPSIWRVDGDSIHVAPKEALLVQWQPSDSTSFVAKVPAYNLVVGQFTNLTNAKAHAAQFAEGGVNASKYTWQPMILRKGNELTFYVAVAHSDSLQGIVAPRRAFLRSGLSTVGIPLPIVHSPR